jgi:hypothetical protein
MYGTYRLSKALFGIVVQRIVLWERGLFCKAGFLLTDLCKKNGTYSLKKETARSCFSLPYLIRLKGRVFLSPERSKLCFELLEILSAAQNHLPLQGTEKNSKVVF